MIQPIGVLLGYRRSDGVISYLSENAEDYFGKPVRSLLGGDAQAFLGSEGWHALQNAATNHRFASARIAAGRFELAERIFDVHAFLSGDFVVVEFEPAESGSQPAPYSLNDIKQLTDLFTKGEEEQEVMETAVGLLRTVSGYDRLMAYRFDHNFNGQVIAEEARSGMEPYLGLRFPHWDIPEQARAIMTKVPLRLINDAGQEPARIETLNAEMPPLDITYAHLRGVSPVHMQYLRNMGAAATMTLPLMIGGNLWGMLSFHHRRPRIPPVHVRQLCEAMLPALEDKLTICMQREHLKLFDKIETVRDQLQKELDSDPSLMRAFSEFASILLGTFRAQGVALVWEDYVICHGQTPEEDLIRHLVTKATESSEQVFATDRILEDTGFEAGHDNGIAGALVVAVQGDRAFCVFRQSLDQQVTWAGSPGHEVERIDGTTRLAPRSSFKLYLETVKDQSDPWQAMDVRVATSMGGTLMIAWNERRSSAERVRRQQVLMIDELNHRVRNILALVRSISRQARRHNPSLESYSSALEQRIMALAAAHDIGAGQPLESVSLRHILHIDAQPHIGTAQAKFRIRGDDAQIRAEFAPIVALVVHEMTTNAVKHGALSISTGRVDVRVDRTDDGVSLEWRETGGPTVGEPNRRGFGSTLIEQAVPFELGGQSDLRFKYEGVELDLFIPNHVLDADKIKKPETIEPIAMQEPALLPDPLNLGTVLVVEDNFIIANDLAVTLKELGVSDVEIGSNPDDARRILDDIPIDIAILDINLGFGSSGPLALEIHGAGIPLFFITGYGMAANVPEGLPDCPVLRKPVSKIELAETLTAIIGKMS